MKTKIYIPLEQLENTDYRKFIIEIRLDDECKNGHMDFAITGMGWYKTSRRSDCNICGCMHEEILKLRPDLKIFVDLHLNDRKGVPMYAIANGFYYLQEGKTDILYDHLMLNSNDELNQFKNCPDKEYFQYLIEKLELPTRWQNKANKAIEILEGLTGEKFTDTSTKETYTFLTDEQKIDIENKIQSGFYTDEQINKRKYAAKIEKRDRYIQEKRNEANKEKHKIDIELRIKILLAKFFIYDGFIFYNHTKELVFNWQKASYYQYIDEKLFDRVKKALEKHSLFLDGEIKTITFKA